MFHFLIQEASSVFEKLDIGVYPQKSIAHALKTQILTKINKWIDPNIMYRLKQTL